MKTIIITGANGNLGVAVVKKFLDEGYKVIAVSQSGNHLGFAAEHENFELKNVNLQDEAAATEFVDEAVSLYGRIDGALMLVGGFAMGDIAATDGAALQKMYSMNFQTAYYTARPLFMHMMENGYGRLAFIGAKPGLKPELGTGMVGYTLGKALLFTLAGLLNAAGKDKNVSSTVLAPSTIDTPLNRKEMPDADTSGWVKPEEIADTLERIFH